jgi:Phosphodiester glycosidase
MPGVAPQPRFPAIELASSRLRLADGAATTLHVARFSRDAIRPSIILLPGTQTLRTWCAAEDIPDAIVGGYFARPAGAPLGELRIGSVRVSSIPFDSPWDAVRSCLHIDGRDGCSIRMARRSALAAEPEGDLLQAGPLLVSDGAEQIHRGVDPEGFSAGAGQFDSDITDGRYPRAALALAGDDLLAVVSDGRARDEAGLTLAELAEALVELGAHEAINLDGGGSASLVVGGRLRNRPREEHGVPIPAGRPIATAIAFLPV